MGPACGFWHDIRSWLGVHRCLLVFVVVVCLVLSMKILRFKHGSEGLEDLSTDSFSLGCITLTLSSNHLFDARRGMLASLLWASKL
jgi:hypothetical protein